MSENTQSENEIVFPEDDFTTTSVPTEETTSTPHADSQPAEEQIQVTDNQQEKTESEQLDLTQDGTESHAASFADFGFSDELMKGIAEAGFTEPTPIQQKAMPDVLAGHDIIGQALTGSGKTAAFGLPIIDKIRHQDGLNFLVLVPTRELATQVSGELFRLGRYTGLKTAAFTGGQSYTRQEAILSHGINALVATPGRLIDLIKSGHFKDINPAHIVVDEADEMLDMGFIEDVRTIFATFPGPHQTMLFSATMPKPVIDLAAEILNAPVNITTSIQESANNDIEQLFFVIEESERANAVIRLIDAEDVTKAMIFCRTKEETDALNILLSARGYNVNCLHGDMEQAQRSRVMNAFRRGEIDILVATDVAARGLDVDDVTHVFNYHLPFDSRGYVHRIGRTGRAGKAGTAITLVTPREMRQLDMIRKTVGAQIENRLVPTRTEVTEMRLKKIFRDLNEVQLDVNLLNQVQTLTTNQDLEVLIAKLVAHELAIGGDTGPEHIGIGGQRLARLLSPKPRERRSFNDRDGGFGRRRSGRRSDDDDSRYERRERSERRRHDDDDSRFERHERRRHDEADSRPAFKYRSDERPAREEFAPVDGEEHHEVVERRDERPTIVERDERPTIVERDEPQAQVTHEEHLLPAEEKAPQASTPHPESSPRHEFTDCGRERDDDRPRKDRGPRAEFTARPEFTDRGRERDDDRPRKDRGPRSEFTSHSREGYDERPRKDRGSRPEYNRPEFTARGHERKENHSEDYSSKGLKGKAAQKERRQFFKQLAESKLPKRKQGENASSRKYDSGSNGRGFDGAYSGKSSKYDKKDKGGKGKKDRFNKQDKPIRNVPPPPPSNWYFN